MKNVVFEGLLRICRMEAVMLSEEIEIGRCLCIHSQLQAVDILLQSLLYQRGIVPSVVIHLLSAPESQPEVRFVDAYTKVCLLFTTDLAKAQTVKVELPNYDQFSFYATWRGEEGRVELRRVFYRK